MLYWAAVFFVIAMVAGVLGLSQFAGSATTAALVMFWIFQGLFTITLILGLAAREHTM